MNEPTHYLKYTYTIQDTAYSRLPSSFLAFSLSFSICRLPSPSSCLTCHPAGDACESQLDSSNHDPSSLQREEERKKKQEVPITGESVAGNERWSVLSNAGLLNGWEGGGWKEFLTLFRRSYIMRVAEVRRK